MLKKILIGVLVLVVAFFGYVATRNSYFKYETSGIIPAPPEKVFPYVSDLRMGEKWSPYEKGKEIQKEFVGPSDQVGGKYIFKGDSSTGSGHLEITKLVPNQMVEIHLVMTEPLPADNMITYQLEAVPEGTKFTWSMAGDGGFIGKLMSVLIDCEKMMTDQFKVGIANLQALFNQPHQ